MVLIIFFNKDNKFLSMNSQFTARNEVGNIQLRVGDRMGKAMDCKVRIPSSSLIFFLLKPFILRV